MTAHITVKIIMALVSFSPDRFEPYGYYWL